MIRAASADELEQLFLRYADDPRQGVQQALSAAARRVGKAEAEQQRLDALYQRLDGAKPGSVIIGLDEVGRGALAGPLLVAAVVLPAKPRILGLDDSKRLTAREREAVAKAIREAAIDISLAWVEAREIDRMGLAAALRVAFAQAIAQMDIQPDQVLLDGRPLGIHPGEVAIVGGDGKEAAIAAASVVAKVARDAWMAEADERYPGYGFKANKGYGSEGHIAALRQLGMAEIHRRGFCESLLATQERLF